MKKIALLTNNTNRHVLHKKILGIRDAAVQKQLELTLHIFHSRAYSLSDPEYRTGENNIFRLPDFSDYDAFILDLHNTLKKGSKWFDSPQCRQLIQEISAREKPCVSIGGHLDKCFSISINDYDAMFSLMEHLDHAHGCKTFWFITGQAECEESCVRTKACLDYVKTHFGRDDHGLVFQGDFTPECGVSGFESFVNSQPGLPDAIVCSSDVIALGVLKAANDRGFCVPEDFLITGFDHRKESTITEPALTTVDQHWSVFGAKAIDILMKLWNQEPVSETEGLIRTSLICSESCSCKDLHSGNRTDTLFDKAFESISLDSFVHNCSQLEYNLLKCETVNQIGSCFQESLPFLQCESFYLVLDSGFLSYKAEDAYLHLRRKDTAEIGSHFPIEGYPRSMKAVFSFENGRLILKDQPVRSLSFFEGKREFSDYLFLPIHFGKFSAGYMVIQDSLNFLHLPYLSGIIHSLSTAIENLYIRRMLSRYNRILSDVSGKDAMTGFYNRLGYQRAACPLFEDKRNAGEDMTIVFIDMDKLKLMNDRYGHECGDYALTAITAAIDRQCENDVLKIRMGGDEFLLIMNRRTDEQVETLLRRIADEIPLTEQVKHLPYAPTISAGYLHTDHASRTDLDEYVKNADQLMYQVKKQKHDIIPANTEADDQVDTESL